MIVCVPTINIKGESFRLKEKRHAGLLSQQAPDTTAAPARDSAKIIQWRYHLKSSRTERSRRARKTVEFVK
jgi:hypothetical protein